LGSIPEPWPARTWVIVVIVMLPVLQPLGSIAEPWPARTQVIVVIVMLRLRVSRRG
jgi:hypothetical protein